MATKPNQREDRVRPQTPALASNQTLNVYGAPKAPAPKPAAKPVPKPTATPKPRTSAEISKTADDVLRQLGEAGARVAEQEKTIAALLKEEQDRLKRVAAGQAGQGDEDKKEIDKDTRDAFAIIKGVFLQYGLGDLGATIETLMREGYGPEEATLALKTDSKYNAAYIKRFKGNETRRAAGLNVLTEAEYLTLEDDYTKTLKSYGLESYFGVDKATKQSAIADIIGADVSAVEFTDRVSTAVDRVKMADPATKDAFQKFYGIGEADLVSYFLDPKKTLVNLKEKATAAEIGGAAIGQGLAATATSAEDLARFGVTREQAQVGYGQIAEDLSTTQGLTRVFGEANITYNQTDAEAAKFKGLASAKRKEKQLRGLEENLFSGSSGTALGAGALSTQYLRRSSSAGQF
jgi:hypothetical protein